MLSNVATQIELASLCSRPVDPLGRGPFFEARNVKVPFPEFVPDVDTVHVHQRHHAVPHLPPSLFVGKVGGYFHVDRHADVLGTRQGSVLTIPYLGVFSRRFYEEGERGCRRWSELGSATAVTRWRSFGRHVVRQAPMDMERRAGVRHTEISHQITELIGGARRFRVRHIETGDRLLRLLP